MGKKIFFIFYVILIYNYLYYYWSYLLLLISFLDFLVRKTILYSIWDSFVANCLGKMANEMHVERYLNQDWLLMEIIDIFR